MGLNGLRLIDWRIGFLGTDKLDEHKEDHQHHCQTLQDLPQKIFPRADRFVSIHTQVLFTLTSRQEEYFLGSIFGSGVLTPKDHFIGGLYPVLRNRCRIPGFPAVSQFEFDLWCNSNTVTLGMRNEIVPPQ